MTIKLYHFTILLTILIYSSTRSETIRIQDAQLRLVSDVVLSSRDAGVVAGVAIKAGDQVVDGQLVVQLENDVHATQYAIAKKQVVAADEKSTNDVNVRFAKKSAEVARKEFERVQTASKLYKRSISQSQLEKTELEVQQAQLSGEQAAHEMTLNRLTLDIKKSELELANIKLKHRAIRAPKAGQIAEVMVQEGEWVNLGAPVARLVDLRKLRVVALVPDKRLYETQRDQMAEFSLQLGESKVVASGTVSFISPEVNPVNREFVIWVDIDNRDLKLRPGMVGSLAIQTAKDTGKP